MNIPTEYKTFRIEKLDPLRIKDLVYLFKVSFNAEVSEAFLLNKNQYCHGEIKFVGFLAYDMESGEPAAFYGVYPAYLVYKSSNYLIAQSGDTMTNPKYQKQGLFVYLANITYDYCQSIGIQLITGLPNQNSFPGFIKYLGFKEFDSFENLLFIENKLELNRITSRWKVFSNIHKYYLKALIWIVSQRSELPFGNSCSSLPDVAYMLHDRDFYTLKIGENDIQVSMFGVKVWLRIQKNVIEMVDLEDPKDDKKIRRLVNVLKVLTLLSGYRFLLFGSTKNSNPYKLLNPFAKSKTKGYTFIIKNLNSELPLESIAYLSCDADVF